MARIVMRLLSWKGSRQGGAGFGLPFLAILLVAAAATIGSARGAIPPAFTVANVAVDATAENAIAARAAALAQGEATAFRQLLERLASPADAARIQPPDADTLTGLVADYQVTDEHSSAVRYIATYTFRFNPRSMRDFLSQHGIAFTEMASRPVVVVPILGIDGGTHLWDDPNPWRDAWNAGQGQAGLVPWVMPAGDIQDVGDFDLNDAANPPPEKLAAISARYGGGDIVVAKASETSAGDAAHLSITLARYNSDGVAQTIPAEASSATANSALYQAGVRAAAQALEASWKNATFSAATGNDQSLQAAAPIASISDWGRIRARLAQVPLIHKVTVDYMTRDEVRVTLGYAGDVAALKLAMAQQNLQLADGDPYPTLTVRAGGVTPSIAAGQE